METVGGKIFFGTLLKIVGFAFGERPNASVHIDNAKKGFNKRMWALRHLKRAGFDSEDLLGVYETMLRPVIDFTSVVYDSLLTGAEANDLKKLQRRVLRLIFGQHIPAGYETLRGRRASLFDKFVEKSVKSPVFGPRWFERKSLNRYGTRHEEQYEIRRPRTERMRRNPMECMRRRVNVLGLTREN